MPNGVPDVRVLETGLFGSSGPSASKHLPSCWISETRNFHLLAVPLSLVDCPFETWLHLLLLRSIGETRRSGKIVFSFVTSTEFSRSIYMLSHIVVDLKGRQTVPLARRFIFFRSICPLLVAFWILSPQRTRAASVSPSMRISDDARKGTCAIS
ncbi:hypothetical protein OE88DRAFT_543669 [Heliocybe sulcata]|uniref:Uncharacterized protein n=1 Tax=Heliocybe sulcata TaxID=5364 RepID=A0A5C3MUW2_9AGAM|nr:hypothetical protein OE88DRAFT_543669 [Heliocybe sulcata]